MIVKNIFRYLLNTILSVSIPIPSSILEMEVEHVDSLKMYHIKKWPTKYIDGSVSVDLQ